jgi:hypothetical protein
MAQIIRTNYFTIYQYPDKIEIYNVWDVYKEYGLVLSSEDEIDELMVICQKIALSQIVSHQKIIKKGGGACQQ